MDRDFVFIILMTSMDDCLVIKLKHKQMFLKDVLDSVGEGLDPETVAEKVDQYCKHGNIFLFFELMSLRKEMEKMREQLQASTTK